MKARVERVEEILKDFGKPVHTRLIAKEYLKRFPLEKGETEESLFIAVGQSCITGDKSNRISIRHAEGRGMYEYFDPMEVLVTTPEPMGDVVMFTPSHLSNPVLASQRKFMAEMYEAIDVHSYEISSTKYRLFLNKMYEGFKMLGVPFDEDMKRRIAEP